MAPDVSFEQQLHASGMPVEVCSVHKLPVYYYYLVPWPVGVPVHEYVCEAGHIVRLVEHVEVVEQLSFL